MIRILGIVGEFILKYNLLFIFLISFSVTYIVTKPLIKHLRKAGILGRDKNKIGEVYVPEMGGFAIVAGLLAGILLKIGISSGSSLTYLLAASSSILIVSLVGVIDDLFVMEQRLKAVLPVLASVPLMAVKAGTDIMYFPFIGAVELGLLYVILFIPLGVTGASNAYNMLAGLNGLEAGMGVISATTLFITAVLSNSDTAAAISISLIGSLLAFLCYNKYPAKIFPGDIGTLTIGCTLASISIIGNLERVGMIVTSLYFIELFLKARYGFKTQSFGIATEKGLKAPEKISSLTHIAIKLTGSERKSVILILSAQIFIGIIALLDLYMNM